MTRQINLLSLPPRPWKWLAVLAGLSLSLILHLSWGFWLQSTHDRGEQQLQSFRLNMAKLDRTMSLRRAEPMLAADIQRQTDLKSVTAQLQALSAWQDWQAKGVLGTRKGLSPVLEKLASAPPEGLLLTQIDIKGQRLALQGLALGPQQVLAYKDTLNQEALALGYVVSGIEIGGKPTPVGLVEFKLYGSR